MRFIGEMERWIDDDGRKPRWSDPVRVEFTAAKNEQAILRFLLKDQPSGAKITGRALSWRYDEEGGTYVDGTATLKRRHTGVTEVVRFSFREKPGPPPEPTMFDVPRSKRKLVGD